MRYDGEYVAPEDLARIYTDIHFNWCVDLCGDDNSRWLLPNRLYEGGYFGIPAVAMSGHEAGKVVRERRWGVVLEPPILRALQHYLETLTPEKYGALRSGIEAMPVSDFVDLGEVCMMVRQIADGRRAGSGFAAQRVEGMA
jgi:succinoglycan biosynthesis protein ExoL